MSQRRALIVVTSIAHASCGGNPLSAIPTPEGVSWYVNSLNFACRTMPAGEYIEAYAQRLSPERCVLDNMMANCHRENVSRAFDLEDHVSDDPGPWHREEAVSLDLYEHNLGRASASFRGTGSFVFSQLRLTATSNSPSVRVAAGVALPRDLSAYHREALASITHFDRAVDVTPTHAFAIDYRREPIVQVWAEAHGDGAGPFVFLYSSMSYAIHGTVNADFRACHGVRLVTRDNYCVFTDDEGTPVAQDCAHGSTFAMHYHARNGKLLLLDVGDVQCLAMGSGGSLSGVPVVKEPCVTGDRAVQQWSWDSTGRLHPGRGDLCLAVDPTRPRQSTPDFRGHSHTQYPLIVRRCAAGLDYERWRFY